MSHEINSDAGHPVEYFDAEIPQSLLDIFRRVSKIGIDIETTGLDWSSEEVRTIQISDGGANTAVVSVRERLPRSIRSLLEDGRIQKVFHHALFDLRFMCFKTDAIPTNIFCTKIAGKLLWPTRNKHDLKGLLSELLGVEIDKSLRSSDWSAAKLSVEQVKYAANDVLYLPKLSIRLQELLTETGKDSLAIGCFSHITTRTYLDIGGYPDVFTY